ncbi:MAG TPA: ATP-binding protein, partial [Candidatus Acidoferrum sp.]|nr:ATP-binding protein [Candidatus Acidoferrum sp.]
AVAIDPLLLKQAVSNIIDNAVNSYESRSGIIEVTSAVDNGELVMKVADHGCGIPKESLDKIFTPFYSSRPSGTGLGLPLAARLVDLHGGRITVDSDRSSGTRFTIRLPLMTNAVTTKAETGRPVSTA